MKFQNIIKLSLAAFIFFAAGQISTGTLFAGSGSSEENDFVLEPHSQEGMLGEVKLFAGNFAPRTWMECNGQLLSIASNQALFSILGTMYGGDGRTTFALPDLRGRTAVGIGNGRDWQV
ncbi:MAG: tail fiber protein [Saprospiraceae bacterium]